MLAYCRRYEAEWTGCGDCAEPGTNWLSKYFDPFAQGTMVDMLPFDHHMLAGLVAPRGLYVIENLDYLWLGPLSSYWCMSAGRLIYNALGASDSMGFSQIGGHSHCSFDSRQQSELNAFVTRFLAGGVGEYECVQGNRRVQL
jgi:hypothetical protein